MKKILSLLALIFVGYASVGQITLIGHNMINNTPVNNTTIFVKEGGVITQSLNTKSKTDFKIQLEFGKIYKIYLQNPKCPLMHLEVLANNIPKDRYNYMMIHE